MDYKSRWTVLDFKNRNLPRHDDDIEFESQRSKFKIGETGLCHFLRHFPTFSIFIFRSLTRTSTTQVQPILRNRGATTQRLCKYYRILSSACSKGISINFCVKRSDVGFFEKHMKFGKEFRIHLEETLPGWRDKYLCYKLLKKLLKNIPEPAAVTLPPPGPDGVAEAPSLPKIQEWFVGILNEELEKFNDFYVDKEEDFIIRFQALKVIIERVKEKGSRDGVFPIETEFGEEMMEIRRDFVAIHGEMVLLKNYSSLNLAGLIKILKKYDKRTGELLSLPFTQLAVHQPFFITEPLTRLVLECEENLEVLFPPEAEVVESTVIAQEQMPGDISNTCFETTLPLGEEMVDISRSISAARRALQGLKKESSTYNPLSLSYLFGNQDHARMGDVTAENSPCEFT